MKAGISPSIMCANPLELKNDILALERAGSAYFHFDIMDGAFVPNFTLGPDLVKAVRQVSGVPADIHLMVNNPEQHLHLFDLQPGDVVSVHVETTKHLLRTLSLIREYGAHPAVALNPGTPLCMVEEALHAVDMLLVMSVNPGFAGQKLIPTAIDKIARAKELLLARGLGHVLIEVDGNVSYEHAKAMRAAGADIFVAGTSAVFAKGQSIEENMRTLHNIIA